MWLIVNPPREKNELLLLLQTWTPQKKKRRRSSPRLAGAGGSQRPERSVQKSRKMTLKTGRPLRWSAHFLASAGSRVSGAEFPDRSAALKSSIYFRRGQGSPANRGSSHGAGTRTWSLPRAREAGLFPLAVDLRAKRGGEASPVANGMQLQEHTAFEASVRWVPLPCSGHGHLTRPKGQARHWMAGLPALYN